MGLKKTFKKLGNNIKKVTDAAITKPLMQVTGIDYADDVANSVKKNWNNIRTPLLVGAGTALTTTGIGAALGAPMLAAAGAGAIAGASAATTTGINEHNQRAAVRDQEEAARKAAALANAQTPKEQTQFTYGGLERRMTSNLQKQYKANKKKDTLGGAKTILG